MARLSRYIGVWKNDVSAFVCLSEFSKALFTRAGFSPGKLHVKSNFIPSGPVRNRIAKTPEPSVAFIGRLSEEKGYKFLLTAWIGRKERLFLAGSGDNLEAPANIEHLGQLGRSEILHLIEKSWVIVVPSIWHETFGLVVVEAFMLGTPVLASANGTFETLIENGRTGMLFKIGDEEDFQDRLNALLGDGELRNRITVAARAEYERRYTPDVNGRSLEEIYLQVMAK
jgi:glycosyltransferase involved in cell wall biosynthesis